MLLEVNNLSVAYGHAKAIDDVSFSVATGEIVAMLGSNGAGKSTALKAISGIVASAGGLVTSGYVSFQGEPIAGYRPDQLVMKGLALVPEGRRVFASMTVRENLEMGAFVLRDTKLVKSALERVLGIFEPLRGLLVRKAGTLSGGEQQMLSLGRAMMLEPRLLLLDEPLLGLSPGYVDIIFETLRYINHAGTSILIVEQNARMALDLCDRAYVFNTGKIAFSGGSDYLLSDSAVLSFCFGEDFPSKVEGWR